MIGENIVLNFSLTLQSLILFPGQTLFYGMINDHLASAKTFIKAKALRVLREHDFEPQGD